MSLEHGDASEQINLFIQPETEAEPEPIVEEETKVVSEPPPSVDHVSNPLERMREQTGDEPEPRAIP